MNPAISFLKKYGLFLIISAIFIFSTLLKFAEVANFNFPFTTDQGRDLVDIRQMVVTHTPRLIGPTTSINGVMLGPFWYYFLLPPFLLSGGNPQAVIEWQILWYQISGLILWLTIKRKNPLFATIIGIFFLLAPIGFNTARYFWNANAMPIFTVLFISTLIWTLDHYSSKKALLTGLIAGLSMQIEAAFGIMFFPISLLIFFLNRKKIKAYLYLFFGFFITLIPQILFEFRHGFIMTKLLIAELFGRGEMLGQKMTFLERASQRYSLYLDMLKLSSHLPNNWTIIISILGIIIALGLFLKKKSNFKLSNILQIIFVHLLFSIVFYLVFSQIVKNWYVFSFAVYFVFFSAFLVYSLLNSKNVLLKSLGLFVVLATIYYSGKSQLDYIHDVVPKMSNDRSNLRNELSDIDWVYENAHGRGFKAYSYLPSVYDFPYHYLYWWYGNRQYGYEPAEVAYLPNQPEYLKDNQKIWQNTKPLDQDRLVFLIVEKDLDMPQREAAWLGNFSHLCKIKENQFYWTAKTIMLQENCPKTN